MHVITIVIKQSFDSAALLLYCWKHLSSNFIFLQKQNVRLRNANFGKIIFLCGGGALEFNAYTSTVYSLLWETPVSVRLKQLANGYIFNVLPARDPSILNYLATSKKWLEFSSQNQFLG